MTATRLPVAHNRDNAHILIALTQQHVLDDIASSRRMNPSSVNYVDMTRDPDYVLAQVAKAQVDIVITGQRFFDCDSLKPEEQKSTFLAASIFSDEELIKRHFRFRHSYPSNGTQLSHAVHRVNPHVLVFRYAEMPDHDCGKIVGDIPRIGSSNRSIVDFIDEDSLAEILSEKAWWRFRAGFPAIRFYDSLEKYHS